MRADTKGKRQRSLQRRLCYAAIPTILAFLIIEGLFRVYVLVQDNFAIQKRYEEMSHRPAYASKPWFTHEFVASLTASCPGLYTPRGTRLVLRMDYKDRLFSVRDGFRGTVGFDPRGIPPGRRPRKLFVFGGSTTYCEEVPDEFTWASQLQRRLAAIAETRDIEVVNCGIPAAVSIEELERLEYEIGRNNIPDFCIFLDGLNDANQGVVNGNPGSTVREVMRDYSNAGLIGALRRIARLSVSARTIYQSIVSSQRQNEPPPRPETEVRELAKAVAEAYERNMFRAKEICDRYHIRMIVFLQPHVFSISGRPWTTDERAAAKSTRSDYADALRACYPLLREKLDQLRQRGIPAYDISDAFDGNLEPVFVDSLFHVESTGNGLIADAILKKVLPALQGLSSSSQLALPFEPDRRAER
jgi:lysophospholipase L1-like esterase